MAAREDFTDDEWYELRSAPWRAAMGVIEVDPSGILTTGNELDAVEAVLAASQFDEDLVGLVTRDLLDQDSVSGEDIPSAGHSKAVHEANTTDGDFPDRVIEAMTALGPILDSKVAPVEAATFRQWLLTLATAAAEAGREGFAGLTGPQVSENEAAYLDRLKATLGLS